MNPVVREKAIEKAKELRTKYPTAEPCDVKETLALFFESFGADLRTAYTNAQEIYAEVYR